MSVTCETETADALAQPGLAGSVAKIGRLSTVYLLGTIAPQVIGMLLLPVFTRYLVPAQMGIVTLAGRVGSLLAIVLQLGLWSGLKSLYFQTTESQRPQLVRTVLVGQLAQAALLCTALSVAGLWIAGPLLPNLELSENYVLMLWLMIVWGCLFGAIVQLGAGLCQLREQAGMSVAITFFNYVTQAGLGVVAVVGLGWQGFGRQGTAFAASILAAALAIWVLWPLGRGGLHPATFARVSRVGVTFVPHQVAGVLAVTVNAWLLSKMDSPGTLAVFGIATAFVQLIDLPLWSFNNAAYPTLAELMSEGGPEARRQQSRLYTFQTMGVGALCLGVSLFAPVAIVILTESKYHAAQGLVAPLTLGMLFEGLYLAVGIPIFYRGGGLWLASATVSGTVLGLVIGVTAIPVFGVYGAVAATTANYLALFVVAAAASYYLYPLPWEVGKISRGLACAVVLALLDCWWSPGMPVVWAVLLKTALFLAFIPALLGVRAISREEIRRGLRLVTARVRPVVRNAPA